MAFTYEELKEKTAAELREIASGIQHDAVQGYTQLNRDVRPGCVISLQTFGGYGANFNP